MHSTQSGSIFCATCSKEIKIRIYSDPTHPKYLQPIVAYERRKFCSVACQKTWQQITPWEDRVGKDFADAFRHKMHILSSENNPSTFPGVAAKIGQSLSNYLKANPRIGSKNPFFGRKHKPTTIDHWRKTKRGKWSYTQAQYEKSKRNTPKGPAHPNWKQGASFEEYGPEFNKSLKQQIKESYEFKCQICDTETKLLDVHHIDYDKTNNSWNNLIPLCKRCHGKTNYNRNVWIPICQQKVKRLD